MPNYTFKDSWYSFNYYESYCFVLHLCIHYCLSTDSVYNSRKISLTYSEEIHVVTLL
jgi:hypothetical protein